MAMKVLSAHATPEERQAFIAEYEQLKREHHAVILDEIKEHGEKTGGMRIHHYQTCEVCKVEVGRG